MIRRTASAIAIAVLAGAVYAEQPVTEADRDHWAFSELSRPVIPKVADDNWARTGVDRFILVRLRRAGLHANEPATRATAIRRLSFNLTGLPPDPGDVESFRLDPAPDAYDQVIDRLLASPSYGEHWAQHWLDLARFAETDGFEHDKVRPNAWRFRDWVIDAFSADMPYDRFVRAQLAGDELVPDSPAAAIATGFLLCGPDMPDINLQEERRHNFLNDMTSTVGSVFLGLQIGCAQCHDHKFDPISQHDFYRLRSFFENADIFKEHAIPTPEQVEARAEFERNRARQWKVLEAEIRNMEARVVERVRRERRNPKLQVPKSQIAGFLTEAEKTKRQRLNAELKSVKDSKIPSLPTGRVMREHTAQTKPSYLWVRGDFRRQGEQIKPGFPRIAAQPDDTLPAIHTLESSSGRRRALADWITRADNRLLTRVIANRLWQHHFGRGLSASESDFGLMGEEPTHPKLLDWLATELPRRHWSLKSMHRLLLTSAVYRQSSRSPADSLVAASTSSLPLAGEGRRGGSTITPADQITPWRRTLEADPRNQLWSRMPRRRLTGEAIRDSMLIASGSLSRRRGGPGVRPPLPNEIVSTLLRNQWPVTKNEEDHRRRSIYLFVRRNLRFPIFEAFDRPDMNASCARRNVSTIAPQSLMLLNSEFSLISAQRLAEFLRKHADTKTTEQIRTAWQRTLSREPRRDELTHAKSFLESDRPDGEHRDDRLTDLCLALFNLNEFVYVD